ncbi:MarR family winged helix-turn-helix transcriptional regulator [Allokutzneria albata]|uniref:DNA-binding transcriptional regulator, MarR family n=1 Tax=Allokutzneria albata TaxID=211114 RepID=A0A1G9VRL7_ALLAB|nr:MarR family transcriptional regulator [Allokutzneria albata]SDM74829.1 DNA-binding transcriptional regulator, MarR family [Allokutzneria albata]
MNTLRETEQAFTERLDGLELDFDAMAALHNLHRTAAMVRNHFEQSVLREAGLTWAGFGVLWVVWIWESVESGQVAKECGVTKGTLTGVVRTLESRGWLERSTPEDDRRRSVLSLTEAGLRLMKELFPKFNAEEVYALGGLSRRRVTELNRTLRHVMNHLEATGPARRG